MALRGNQAYILEGSSFLSKPCDLLTLEILENRT